jgi:hypothetical protein
MEKKLQIQVPCINLWVSGGKEWTSTGYSEEKHGYLREDSVRGTNLLARN